MFDSDVSIGDALFMTLGGLGMAFLVLFLLMIMITSMGWLSRRVSRESAASSSDDQGAAVAAAVAVSVAVAADQQAGRPPGRHIVPPVAAASNWARRGRLDIMESRMGRVRRR